MIFSYSALSKKAWVFPLLAFFIPLIVRGIPEIIMGPYIVGFDSIAHYIPTAITWSDSGVTFWNLLATAPLFYMILIAISSTGLQLILSLKLLAPILLGTFGLVIFFYAKENLGWSEKKCLFSTFFVSLYFIALRVSWDMLRTQLGLIFLFLSLIFLTKSKDDSIVHYGLFSLSIIAAVFSHQLVAGIMFFIIFLTVIKFIFNNRGNIALKLIICTFPAIILFSLVIYANYLLIPDFSVFSGWIDQNSTVFLNLFDSGYPDFIGNVLFLIFCYLPILPFVLIGFSQNRSFFQLNSWILFIGVSLLLSFVNYFLIVFPYRWILLLTYPLCFYAVDGITKIKSKKISILSAFLIGVFSFSFLIIPGGFFTGYFTFFPSYVPTSMLQNSVSISDCPSTVANLQWINQNLPDNSIILVHRAFYGWALLYIDGKHLVNYEYEYPNIIAQELTCHNSTDEIYTLWWTNGAGWYNQPFISSSFQEIHHQGNIGVYRYASDIL